MIMQTPTVIPNDRTAEQRIRIRVPKHYHQEPVISHLISHYALTVNIIAAVLGANANGDGWFDLDLKGSHAHIQAALTYLDELDLEVWQGEESDGW
jgi:ABC-type methionine transport system ATPase subunit